MEDIVHQINALKKDLADMTVELSTLQPLAITPELKSKLIKARSKVAIQRQRIAILEANKIFD